MVQICQHCRTLWLFGEQDVGDTVTCPKCRVTMAVETQSLEDCARVLAEHDQQRQSACAPPPITTPADP